MSVGLVEELVAQRLVGRLAVPARVGVRERRRRALARARATSSPTLRQSVSLPPKMLTWRVAASTSTTCLRESCIQSVAPLDRVASTASGRTPQRSAMMSASVSGRGRRRRLLMLSRTKRRSSAVTCACGLVDARVGRADAGARPHRDDEEEAAVVGEEGEHAPVRREPVDDEVDALREDVAVLRLLAGEPRSSRRRRGRRR